MFPRTFEPKPQTDQEQQTHNSNDQHFIIVKGGFLARLDLSCTVVLRKQACCKEERTEQKPEFHATEFDMMY